MRRTQMVIDLAALRHNLAVVRRFAPHSRVMAAIKANGYGHGIERVAHALREADAFGVACLDEAIALRRAGITAPIVLLEGFFHAEELPLLLKYQLQSVIHHPFQIEALRHLSPASPLPVWIKIDSGMHRLGILPAEFPPLWQAMTQMAQIRITGIMTHLASADLVDDLSTARQLARFDELVAGLQHPLAIANSAAIIAWPTSHRDWVRPGLMLYGVSPFADRLGSDLGLRPVMTFTSQLFAIRQLPAGAPVGYGGSWRCPEAMPVGVVAVGYGDGYPRHIPNGTPVLINGQRVPVIGRVSMDMITVDLRRLARVERGDSVVLWGEGLPVEEIARAAGTIPYELLCGLTGRVTPLERP
jgi:alanine racemase